MRKTDLPLSEIEGIETKNVRLLERLSLYSLEDLLHYYPRRYEDRRQCLPLKEALNQDETPGEFPVLVEVVGYSSFSFGRGKVSKILVSDGFLRASLLCYNRNFLTRLMKEGERYIVLGNFHYKYNEIQASQFEFFPEDRAKTSPNVMRIVPIYSLTQGLTQGILREILFSALSLLEPKETLPQSMVQKYQFYSYPKTMFQIHFPDDWETLESARKRLKYEELFELEMNVALKQSFFLGQKKKEYHAKSLNSLIQSLPFTLTKSQSQSFSEIQEDLLNHSKPMYRMLQGDVGSGKTIVAILSMVLAVKNGYQAVFMAPTEILARQHFLTLQKLLKEQNIIVEFLVSAVKSSQRKKLLADISGGQEQIVVGTHALFSEGVKYPNLALIVIDEHHKFGVEQRMKLIQKTHLPDILVMSATPIPRTLSLTVYGDLDVSVIREKPLGNMHVKSYCILTELGRKKMYEFMEKQMARDFQGFVVCPAIEESSANPSMTSTMTRYKELKKIFPKRNIAFLHGKQSSEEQEKIMKQFVDKKAKLLVATTVVEVGVDIPNANFMVVENAERFGLSQLHQLRGRIGRGKQASFCFFVLSDSVTPEAEERLKALLEHEDGFQLAEEDLRIRGPGEFLGKKQSGLNQLKLANIIEDADLLFQAYKEAFALVSEDPKLQKKENQSLFEKIYKPFLDTYRLYLSS